MLKMIMVKSGEIWFPWRNMVLCEIWFFAILISMFKQVLPMRRLCKQHRGNSATSTSLKLHLLAYFHTESHSARVSEIESQIIINKQLKLAKKHCL